MANAAERKRKMRARRRAARLCRDCGVQPIAFDDHRLRRASRCRSCQVKHSRTQAPKQRARRAAQAAQETCVDCGRPRRMPNGRLPQGTCSQGRCRGCTLVAMLKACLFRVWPSHITGKERTKFGTSPLVGLLSAEHFIQAGRGLQNYGEPTQDAWGQTLRVLSLAEKAEVAALLWEHFEVPTSFDRDASLTWPNVVEADRTCIWADPNFRNGRTGLELFKCMTSNCRELAR